MTYTRNWQGECITRGHIMRVGNLLEQPLGHLSGLIENYANQYRDPENMPQVELAYWAQAITAAVKIGDSIRARAYVHDASKLTAPEKLHFERANLELGKHTYGTPEYEKARGQYLGVALEHHWKQNRHHPEHHDGGIFDMDLIDIIEMFCDWKAATERETGASIDLSIEANKKRFNLDVKMTTTLTNTASELCWIDVPPKRYKPSLLSMLNILCKAYAAAVTMGKPIGAELETTMKSHGVTGQLLNISANTLTSFGWQELGNTKNLATGKETK